MNITLIIMAYGLMATGITAIGFFYLFLIAHANAKYWQKEYEKVCPYRRAKMTVNNKE